MPFGDGKKDPWSVVSVEPMTQGDWDVVSVEPMDAPASSDVPGTFGHMKKAFAGIWSRATKGLISPDAMMEAGARAGGGMRSNIAGGFLPRQREAERQSAKDAVATVHKLADGNPSLSPRTNATLTFMGGALRDTAGQASGLTSPASILTLPAAAYAKAAGPIGTVSRRALTAAGVGFGAVGAKDVVENMPEAVKGNPDAIQNALLGGAMAIGGGTAAVETVARAVPGMFSKKMGLVPPGDVLTRSERLKAAERMGVNLDLAQATDSRAAYSGKNLVENTLAGSGPFAENLQRNLAQLQTEAAATLDSLSPHARAESRGYRVQQAVKGYQEHLHKSAEFDFRDLDQQIGAKTRPVSKDAVQTVAGQIYAEWAEYYKNNPDLLPKSAWTRVEEFATRPDNMTFFEAQALRSDMLEALRNSNDAVRTRAEGWVKRFTKAVDDSMMDASTGLTPSQKAQFRAANDTWKEMKEFDNPVNPLYHALRAPDASTVPGMLSNSGAPEMARRLRRILGPDYREFQRHIAEELINPQGKESALLKNLSQRFKNMEYLREVFTPDQLRRLQELASVSDAVNFNVNPSGSGKIAIGAGDIAGLTTMTLSGEPLSAAGVLAAERGVAKAMVMPGFTKRLSRGSTKPKVAGPGIFAAAVAASKGKEEEQAPDGYTRVRSHLRKRKSP